MTGSVPPPLPTARPCCGSRFPSFLAGLVVGAAAVGVAATGFIQRERARYMEVEALRQAGHAVQDFVGGALAPATPANVGVYKSDADKVKALGDETVDDLRQGRLLAVYKLTTADYKNRAKREEFDKLVEDAQHVGAILPVAAHRESKVRKAAEGDGYEYYCSSLGNGFVGNVVFSFVFEPGDNGAWRIGQFEVSYVNR